MIGPVGVMILDPGHILDVVIGMHHSCKIFSILPGRHEIIKEAYVHPHPVKNKMPSRKIAERLCIIGSGID